MPRLLPVELWQDGANLSLFPGHVLIFWLIDDSGLQPISWDGVSAMYRVVKARDSLGSDQTSHKDDEPVIYTAIALFLQPGLELCQ